MSLPILQITKLYKALCSCLYYISCTLWAYCNPRIHLSFVLTICHIDQVHKNWSLFLSTLSGQFVYTHLKAIFIGHFSKETYHRCAVCMQAINDCRPSAEHFVSNPIHQQKQTIIIFVMGHPQHSTNTDIVCVYTHWLLSCISFVTSILVSLLLYTKRRSVQHCGLASPRSGV